MSENVEDEYVGNPAENTEQAEPEIEIVDEGFESQEDATPEPPKPVVDEDEERQKKHISLKTQFNKVQREKYRAEHEAQELRKELEKYRMLAEQNSAAAMDHYDKRIEMQIAQAKSEKKIAKENGDYDAELAADEKLALAIAQKTQNDAYKAQQQYLKAQKREEPQQQQEYDDHAGYEPEGINEDTQQWLAQNPWFVSQNEEDQALAAEVQAYSAALENRYYRQGMGDKVFTKQYYDDIDNYVRSQLGEVESAPPEPKNPISRSNISMKPVRQAAPPGRAPKGPDAPARRTVTLSPQEKEMARIMNLSEQDYAKWKIKDQEKQAQRGRPY